MTKNPEPVVTPYLLYENVARALAWLAEAFGFEQFGETLATPDGTIQHASMRRGDGIVLMGCSGPEYRNPERLGGVTQSLYVLVDDVDAHFRRAKKAGARILEEPKDQHYGDRRYGAIDLEGHHWYFAQRS